MAIKTGMKKLSKEVEKDFEYARKMGLTPSKQEIMKRERIKKQEIKEITNLVNQGYTVKEAYEKVNPLYAPPLDNAMKKRRLQSKARQLELMIMLYERWHIPVKQARKIGGGCYT